MEQKFSICVLCDGTAMKNQNPCPVCDGRGTYEESIHSLAVKTLTNFDYVPDDEVRALCNRRIADLTPDNIKYILDTIAIDDTLERFMTLHSVGVKTWGKAWFHTNRFAIEFAKLNDVEPTQYGYALTMLAAIWLQQEDTEKSI